MLIDSNILIYAAEPGVSMFDSYFNHEDACITTVSRIEVLGFPGFSTLDNLQKARLNELLNSISELPLDGKIADRTILLRQQRKMKLADAIIAATALEYEVPLVTRNVKDFDHIAELELVNPFEHP